MRIALVNPAWSFEGSVYFGCREPHMPLEHGYAKALLEADGHEVLLADAQLGFTWRTGEDARSSRARRTMRRCAIGSKRCSPTSPR